MSSSLTMTAQNRILATLLVLSSAFCPVPARADDCRSLQALDLGASVLVVLGSRDREPAIPELRLSGCGSGPPSLVDRWIRSADGEWSPSGELPAGARGAVFQHRGRLWTADLRPGSASNPPAFSFGTHPKQPRFHHSMGFHEAGALAIAVATLDHWTFALAEQLAGGTLSVDVITSLGERQTFERQSSLVVPSPWPPGTRLLGLAGEQDRLALFGRAADGRLLTGITEGMSWRAAPPFALEAEAQVNGLWLEGRPAFVVVRSARIELHTLDGAEWTARGEASVPDGRLWAVTSVGAERNEVIAAAWADDRLAAWGWRDGAWTQEVVPEGRAEAVVRPASSAPAVPSGSPWRRLLIALGLLGAAAGAVLTTRLVRRR
jgi:hypothetical protein